MILFLGIGCLTALTMLEFYWSARSEPTTRVLNVEIWALYVAASAAFQLVLPPLTVLATNVMGGGLVDLAAWPLLTGVAAFALAMDLGEYLFHRAQHHLPVLWRMHSLHHSDPNMNATTTGRHFWADPLLKGLTIWPLVGFTIKPTPAILTAYALLGLYNFFSHANLPIDFGRWSWLMNSPAYHRTHHSSDPRDYNVNFAALFPIFDVLFGTYRKPNARATTGLEAMPQNFVDAVAWPFRYEAPNSDGQEQA